MVTIEIDNNNSHVLAKLWFYLNNEKLLTETNSLVLDECIEYTDAPLLFLIPKDPLKIPFADSEIELEYIKTRKSDQFQNKEVRFDLIRLSSKLDMEHLVQFINMIHKLIIPLSRESELCKYIWEEDMWRYNKSFRQRKLETIYLPRKEEIVQTLQSFLEDETRQALYQRLDIPNRFLFLLYGVPGSGKTSLIRALASKFRYNLSIVKNVADINDNGLERMVSSMRKRSFLIFEDIDCLFDQRQMMNPKTNITYSGLLNILDGIGNYENLVIFITTNYIDKLDHAFKRRVDKFIEFTFIQAPEIVAMYTTFFPESTLAQAEKFVERVRYKKLTVNSLEKFFMYCLEKKKCPNDEITYLEEYSNQTSGFHVDHMYT